MANPWSILGLRKWSDGDPVWHGYAKTLRQVSNDAQRRRARDAFEAIELGLWGRFGDAIEQDVPAPPLEEESWTYDGSLAPELMALDRLLAGPQPIDEMAIRDQLERLFDEPALQRADVYLRVEPTLAALLEQHLPRSEPFVLFALDRFHHVTDQALQHPAIARLLDRADELALIEALEAGQGELAKGWRPLAKPASRWQRWLWARDDRRSQAAALYAYSGWRNPRFRRRLDDGEWTWWSQELSRERTSFAVLLGSLLAAIILGVAMNQRQAPSTLATAVSVAASVAVFAFLLIDHVAARTLIARRVPRPFDGPATLIFAAAALILPAFTRFLPPDPTAAGLVAALALAIAWGLRLATGLPGGVRSSAWLDSAGLPVLILLFFALSLSIPWERYAMLASFAWLLHAVLPHLRRAVAMALDRAAALPWGYLLGGAGALVALGAPFAPSLGLNLESTRLVFLVTGYALLSLSVYPRRPFPSWAALIGCVLAGGFLFLYTERGGEYRPGPAPSAGETLLAAERGDVVEWRAFPANGDEILDRIERNNPEAYARLSPIIRNASCERGREGGRACEAYPINTAVYGEVGRLLETMSNRHLSEWTRLEARVRETQFRKGSGACSNIVPQYSQLDPVDIQRAHAALVLDIVASGSRAPAERPNVALPDRKTFERAMEGASRSVAAIEGGPVHPTLRQACVNQLVRARAILSFDTDVAARISRGGYPQ